MSRKATTKTKPTVVYVELWVIGSDDPCLFVGATQAAAARALANEVRDYYQEEVGAEPPEDIEELLTDYFSAVQEGNRHGDHETRTSYTEMVFT